MILDIPVSPVFEVNRMYYNNPKYKIMCNQGGTRSGKTYNIMILLILLALSQKFSISVVSESVPHLKRGAVRDFLSIMKNSGLFEVKRYNITDRIYTFPNGSFIEFFSADDEQKMKGSNRDILFVNEIDSLKYTTWMQLLIRVNYKIFIDYNPSEEFHWIYEKIIPRKDTAFIQSTFLDNLDFLPESLVREIKLLKNSDPNFWRIYGLGERGISQERIYTNFTIVEKVPENIDYRIYGLDFGVNNPSALMEISFYDQNPYIQQKLYQTQLTNNDLIEMLKILVKNKFDKIYADNAEPGRIMEIARAGFNICPANKSVKDGIDYCKSKHMYVTKDSVETIKEFRNYKYKLDRNGNATDEPVKFKDHAMDGARYAMYTDYLDKISGEVGFEFETREPMATGF